MVLRELIPNVLYQGDQEQALLCCGPANYRIAVPKKPPIRAVIQCSYEDPIPLRKGLKLLRLPLRKRQAVPVDHLDLAFLFHMCHGPTLVYCEDGSSRSLGVAAVIADSLGGLSPGSTRNWPKPEFEMAQSVMNWKEWKKQADNITDLVGKMMGQ